MVESSMGSRESVVVSARKKATKADVPSEDCK